MTLSLKAFALYSTRIPFAQLVLPVGSCEPACGHWLPHAAVAVGERIRDGGNASHYRLVFREPGCAPHSGGLHGWEYRFGAGAAQVRVQGRRAVAGKLLGARALRGHQAVRAAAAGVCLINRQITGKIPVCNPDETIDAQNQASIVDLVGRCLMGVEES